MIDIPVDKARQKALRAALTDSRRVSVYGLAGSATAVMLSETGRKRPMVVVADSLDDAGYLYHDLCRLCGDDAVAILPSGYKRHIKYGQPDPPQQILRNEATAALYAKSGSLRFLVTYPEALAEKVASPTAVTAHTLHIAVGSKLNLTETEKWLRGNGFKQEDYVYEPGHFAVRGSILDIYGYSSELPFRIDLFGEDVDSIRQFNIETQLSEQKMEAIEVAANVGGGTEGGSLLDYLDPATVIAVRDDATSLAARVAAVAAEKFSLSAAEADEGDADASHEDVYSSEDVQGVPGTDSNDDTTYILDEDDTTYIIDDDGSSNPMLSTDWETLPLEEARDYLPNESIIISDAPVDKTTMHTYTPADGESQGTLGHEDIYGPEEKVDYDYLPNEAITTTVFTPREVNVDELDTGCYVYVKADFGRVQEKYREEMEFIDSELQKAAGDVIILSINRNMREKLFDALTENRTPYVGDNARVGELLTALPLPPTMVRKEGFSLQTVKAPYSLRFTYEMSTDLYTQEDRDMLYFNAAMLFYAIGNVEEIVIDVTQPTTYVQDSTGTRDITKSFGLTYRREEMEQELPALRDADYENDEIFREKLSDLHAAIEAQLAESP